MDDPVEKVFQDFRVRKVIPGLAVRALKVILGQLALTGLMDSQVSRANEAFQVLHCLLL